ncbi:hypothetical protein HDK64DRAFT_279932 [Phyllosticta capitalensis]
MLWPRSPRQHSPVHDIILSLFFFHFFSSTQSETAIKKPVKENNFFNGVGQRIEVYLPDQGIPPRNPQPVQHNVIGSKG